ncbi:uncharacterized protein LOC123985223, partial [Tachysurus ichikawai]
MDASEPMGASQPVLYEELLEVVTRAIAKLDLDWPVEQQKQRTPRQLCTVTVNMCEPETCTLLRYGLCPATADKPQTAFSIPLLELFVCLSLECHVSAEGFCNTLRWKNNLTLAEVNTLYRALVGESISHFRHHHFRQRRLVDVCPQLDDGTTCPACPKDVEDYLLSHLDSSKPHEDCSNFKAGNVLRSQQQAKKRDVTGVFGASSYPLYFIDALLQRCEDKNIHLRVVYDIACVVASHLQKSGEGIPHNISLAVPAFHVYGHKLPCQCSGNFLLIGSNLKQNHGSEWAAIYLDWLG